MHIRNRNVRGDERVVDCPVVFFQECVKHVFGTHVIVIVVAALLFGCP